MMQPGIIGLKHITHPTLLVFRQRFEKYTVT